MDRRAIRTAYRERPADAGIFAFRGPAPGAVWVGGSPTLGSIENRLRFTLRHGPHRAPGLTEAWAAAGGAGFVFEVLERLDPELSPMARGDALKERAAHWQTALGARPL